MAEERILLNTGRHGRFAQEWEGERHKQTGSLTQYRTKRSFVPNLEYEV